MGANLVVGAPGFQARRYEARYSSITRFGTRERPRVLDELPHLVLVDRGQPDVCPVVAHVALARERELLGVGLDEGLAQLLREREAHRRAVLREGEVDDPADPELDLAAHEPLVRSWQRAREGADVVGRDHRSPVRIGPEDWP